MPGGRTGLHGERCAHDHVALLEGGAERGHLVVGKLVLVGQRLELLLLDETALGGLLEQALGRRQVVQMNSLAQFNAFPWWSGRVNCGLCGPPARGESRDVPVALSEL